MCSKNEEGPHPGWDAGLFARQHGSVADRVLRGGWLQKSAARRPPLDAATSLASTAILHWILLSLEFRRFDRSSRECGPVTAWSVHRTAFVRPDIFIVICPARKGKHNFFPSVHLVPDVGIRGYHLRGIAGRAGAGEQYQ
jgi:hypothetical protein